MFTFVHVSSSVQKNKKEILLFLLPWGILCSLNVVYFSLTHRAGLALQWVLCHKAVNKLTFVYMYKRRNILFFFFLLQWRKALTIAWKLVNIAWPDVPASGEVPRVTDCACDVEFEIRVVEASWGGSSFLLGYTVFSTSWTGRFHLLCGHGMKPARTLGRHSCLKNTIDTSTSHFFFYRFRSVQSSLNICWRIQQQEEKLGNLGFYSGAHWCFFKSVFSMNSCGVESKPSTSNASVTMTD